MTAPMPHQPVEQTLFRLRVRYVKRGRLAYLGHLEVIHTVERIVRRARMPFAVTQGFSPRLRAGFSSALPVGTASSCEWYDLFLTELVPADEALSRLRAASPADLAPQEAAYIALRAPALTADITRACYRIALTPALGMRFTADEVRRALERVVAAGSVSYQRGKKQKVLDFTRTLASFSVEGSAHGGPNVADGSDIELFLDTRCDNEGALRPEILLAALDRELAGSDEPIVSTGIQDLACFSRYRVERVAQDVEQEDGSFADPLGRPVA